MLNKDCIMKKLLWAGLIGLVAACGRNTFEIDGTYTAPDGTILARGLRGEDIFETVQQALQ